MSAEPITPIATAESLPFGAVVTHPDRPGEQGTVIADGRRRAWTPDRLTKTPPAPGMVRVHWHDSLDPNYLSWEHPSELQAVQAEEPRVTAPSTATNAVLALHECDWSTDADWGWGHCACGHKVSTEEEWAEHAGQAVTVALWKADAQQLGSAHAVDELPEGTTILARAGRDNIVCRRVVIGNPNRAAWSDLAGTFRSSARLLPAVVLEHGPAIPEQNGQ